MTDRILLTADERDAYEAPLCETCGAQMTATLIPVDNNHLPVDRWELFEQCNRMACNDDPQPDADGYYPESAKRTFKRPCPACGQNVRVEWLQVDQPGSFEQRWMPAPGGTCPDSSCEFGR